MSYETDGLCHNANPGTYGHECGKPASWIGKTPAGNWSGYCVACRAEGYEARQCVEWRPFVAVAPFRYRPKLRPAGFATLPHGVKWTYVEAPAMDGLANRPDLPQSRYRYGVIETDREISLDDLRQYDLERVAS